MCKVSVIIPLFKVKQDYLEENIRCLRNQTLKDIEMIYVDDCGNDGSIKVLEKSAKQDNRISILHNACNMGAGKSRNAAIDVAKGEYLSFIDADDAVEINFLEILYNLAKNTGCDIAKGTLYFTTAKKFSNLNEMINRSLNRGEPLITCFNSGHHSAIYKRSFIKDNDIHYGTTRISEDVTFLLQVCYYSQSIEISDKAVYLYRDMNDGSLTTGHAHQNYRDYLEAMRERIDFLGKHPDIPKDVHQKIIDNQLNRFNFYLNEYYSNLEEESIKNTITNSSCFNNKLAISVVVPIFNSADYVDELINQMEAQTCKNFELIFVDDGSTDNTAQLILTRAGKNKQIKYFYQENSGAGTARNLGIQHVQGEYFICIDADDLYEPQLLERLYIKAVKNKADITVCAYSRKNYWTNITEYDLGYRKSILPNKEVFSAQDISTPMDLFNQGPINKLYRTEFIKEIGIQYSNTRIGNDIFFTTAAILQAKRITFEKQNLVTVRRYVNENSLSSRRGEYLSDTISTYKELYAYLCKCKIEKKYIRDYFLLARDSISYNCKYKYDPNFIREIEEWMTEAPWSLLCKKDFDYLFSESLINQKNMMYQKISANAIENPNDKKLQVEMNFAKNEYESLKDIETYINERQLQSFATTESIFKIKQTKPNETFIKRVFSMIERAFVYYHAHGLKMTYWRTKTEFKRVIKNVRNKKSVKKSKKTFLIDIDRRLKEVQNRLKITYSEVEQLSQTVDDLQNSHEENISVINEVDLLNKRIGELQKANEYALNKTFHLHSENHDELLDTHSDTKNVLNEVALLNKRVDEQQKSLEKVVSEFKKTEKTEQHIEGLSEESLWADIWNSTSQESKWMENKSFSPGRFAVGYPFLYVLYRILDEVKPKNLLELGLGQSTKLLSQYAKHQPHVCHQVVESNNDWIEFFKRNYTLPINTKIVYLDDKIIEKDGNQVRIFVNFEKTFKDQKFDYICIDAPRGDSSNYSRIDIIPLIPQCLEKSFIIMIDDTQRIGEENTVNKIQQILQENKIEYASKVYKGEAYTTLICSEDLKFLASL